MPLHIKPPRRPSTTAQSPSESASPPTIESFLAGREHTPDAPPVSPLSPVLTTARLSTATSGSPVADTGVPHSNTRPPPQAPSTQHGKTQELPSVQLIDRPAPLPFSGEDSMDAIALRAAISSLQYQRVKAQQDLRTLQQIKNQAVDRPEEFRNHIIDTASRSAAGAHPGVNSTPPPDEDRIESDDEVMTGAEQEEEQQSSTITSGSNVHAGEVPDSQHASFSSTLGSQPQSSLERTPKPPGFPAIPMPQDVVRCPPIEWAKYHIHGESLDRIHREQQIRPGVGGSLGPENVVAAPYNPFVDMLEERTAPRTDVRKDSGASAAEQPTQRRRSSKASPASK